MADQVTPWDVAEIEIDYDRLITQFGCKKIDCEIITRMEKISGKKVHHLIRRGFVFAHRDLNLILDEYEKGEPFYLYTGRGPSTKSLHIGHSIPFLLCKYLQDVFDVPLIIQITDDEKFLFKDLDLDCTLNFATENIKDIISFGFNPEKTFIFRNVNLYDRVEQCNVEKCNKQCNVKQCNIEQCNVEQCNVEKCNVKQCNVEKCNVKQCNEVNRIEQCNEVNRIEQCNEHKNNIKNNNEHNNEYKIENKWGFNDFFKQELRLSKEITFHEGSKIFGFNSNSNLGQITFPVRQILPCYYNIFTFLKKSTCLVPAAIDQDPYFRLARDKAKIFNCSKPSTIYSGFLPSLKNLGKMSSTVDLTIFLDDKMDDIANKIKKHAFSGGRETLAEHRKLGGLPEKDTAFQYLRYFLDDDKKLSEIEQEYRKGILSSKDMKGHCIEELQRFIGDFQKRRAQVDQEIIDKFMSCDKSFY